MGTGSRLAPKRFREIEGKRVEVDELGRPLEAIAAHFAKKSITSESRPQNTDTNRLIATGHSGKVIEEVHTHTATVTPRDKHGSYPSFLATNSDKKAMTFDVDRPEEVSGVMSTVRRAIYTGLPLVISDYW